MLALTGDARRWERKRLRLRIFAVAGRLVRGGRLRLRLAGRWHWTATLPPQGPPVRLTSPNRTIGQEGDTTRDRGTPPADATAGQPGTARTQKGAPADASGQPISGSD
jgi:hypothetical protein